MRSRIRTVVACASAALAVAVGAGVMVGVGSGGRPEPKDARSAAADTPRRGPEGELPRLEAECAFWSREMANLKAQIQSLALEGRDSDTLSKVEIELRAGLWRRAAEADQDARLRLHMTYMAMNQTKPQPKKD